MYELQVDDRLAGRQDDHVSDPQRAIDRRRDQDLAVPLPAHVLAALTRKNSTVASGPYYSWGAGGFANQASSVKQGQHGTKIEREPMMENESQALQTALAYHRAWTTHDMDRAMTYVAEDIICDAPAGRLEGAPAFRNFMEPFSRILVSSELIAAFGDDETALVMYGTATVPVGDAPGAELLTVRDGRIAYMRIIFDRMPFEAARRNAA